MVLPQPDSPTRPRVSPRWISKLTPSTAWTRADRSLHDAAADREVLHQVADLDERDGRQRRRVGARSCASRRRGRGQPPARGPRHRPPAASWYSQHRTSWPARTGSSRGWTSWRSPTSSSIWAGQRGANRHPLGRSIRLGTLPGMTASSSLTAPTTGIEPISPRVYGWSGSPEEGHDVGLLDDLAGVHDRDPIAHLGHDAEVVRDEHDRCAGLVAQVSHEVEDLGLDGHVEGGRGLVRDKQLGLAGEGHRDHHALGHAARHLVREVLEAALRIRDADHPQELDRARWAALPFMPRWMRRTSSIWLADVPHRVQRRGRLLEDHAIRSPRILRISSSTA